MLVFPLPQKTLILDTDASDSTSIGAILSQLQKGQESHQLRK